MNWAGACQDREFCCGVIQDGVCLDGVDQDGCWLW